MNIKKYQAVVIVAISYLFLCGYDSFKTTGHRLSDDDLHDVLLALDSARPLPMATRYFAYIDHMNQTVEHELLPISGDRFRESDADLWVRFYRDILGLDLVKNPDFRAFASGPIPLNAARTDYPAGIRGLAQDRFYNTATQAYTALMGDMRDIKQYRRAFLREPYNARTDTFDIATGPYGNHTTDQYAWIKQGVIDREMAFAEAREAVHGPPLFLGGNSNTPVPRPEATRTDFYTVLNTEYDVHHYFDEDGLTFLHVQPVAKEWAKPNSPEGYLAYPYIRRDNAHRYADRIEKNFYKSADIYGRFWNILNTNTNLFAFNNGAAVTEFLQASVPDGVLKEIIKTREIMGAVVDWGYWEHINANDVRKETFKTDIAAIEDGVERFLITIKARATTLDKQPIEILSSYVFGPNQYTRFRDALRSFLFRRTPSFLLAQVCTGNHPNRYLLVNTRNNICLDVPDYEKYTTLRDDIPNNKATKFQEAAKELEEIGDGIKRSHLTTPPNYAKYVSSVKEAAGVLKGLGSGLAQGAVMLYASNKIDEYVPVDPFSDDFTWAHYLANKALDADVAAAASRGNPVEFVSDMVLDLTFDNIIIGNRVNDVLVQNIRSADTDQIEVSQLEPMNFREVFTMTTAEYAETGGIEDPTILDYQVNFFGHLKLILGDLRNPNKQSQVAFTPLDLHGVLVDAVKAVNTAETLGWSDEVCDIQAYILVNFGLPTDTAYFLESQLRMIEETHLHNLSMYQNDQPIGLMWADRGEDQPVLSFSNIKTALEQGQDYIVAKIEADQNHGIRTEGLSRKAGYLYYTAELDDDHYKLTSVMNSEYEYGYPSGLFGYVLDGNLQFYEVNIDVYEDKMAWTVVSHQNEEKTGDSRLVARTLPIDAEVMDLDEFETDSRFFDAIASFDLLVQQDPNEVIDDWVGNGRGGGFGNGAEDGLGVILFPDEDPDAGADNFRPNQWGDYSSLQLFYLLSNDDATVRYIELEGEDILYSSAHMAGDQINQEPALADIVDAYVHFIPENDEEALWIRFPGIYEYGSPD